jgi:hypothetical protein
MTPGAVVAAIVAMLASRREPTPMIVAGALVLAGAGLWCVLGLPEQPSFVSFWLPVGVLIGTGMGAITTGVSTAAALSVAPERFAAAVGLNQTARLLGGALGVAVLAALLDSGGGIGPFKHVYLFCTLATVAVIGAAVLGGKR